MNCEYKYHLQFETGNLVILGFKQLAVLPVFHHGELVDLVAHTVEQPLHLHVNAPVKFLLSCYMS